MKIIKSIFIWVVLISPFINIFADVLPKQSFKGQLVIVQELKINNDTVRLGVSSEGQLLRYDGTKYTNWTPDFDSLYSVDSVKYLRGRIQIYQGGNIDSTEVLTVDTTQVLNLQQFVENHSINQELDPVYSIDSSFIKSSLRDIISDTANWNIEDDPIYKSDSSFLKSNIRDWNSSVAKLITTEDTTYWNSKLDIELDPIYVEDSSQIVFWSDTTLENGIVTDHDLMMLEPPAGGYANNLYFDTLSSDVAGYQTLTYTVSLTSEEHAHTVNEGEGNKLIHTYIYPTAVTVSVLPAGLWSFQFYSKVSSPIGVTKIGITYFARHIDNTETDLFTIWSNEINNTTYDWNNWQITNPSYAISVTDRMGARIYLQTTKVTDVTVNYYIGDGYGAYLNNPNKIRHSQLRDLNGDSTYLHVTNNDIVYWNNKVDSETDPIYSNDSTFLNSGVRNWNSSLAKTIDANDTTYWGRAETDPKYAADSANIVKYVGNDRDLDMGANSINTDTVKLNNTPLLLDAFKSGLIGGAGTIPYSNGASSQLSFGTVNQTIGGNSLTSSYVPKWDGSKFANSGIYQDGSGNVCMGTTTPFIYSGVPVRLTIEASGYYGVLALKAAQPLIKWSGIYNHGDGAELYQRDDGTFFLNVNANTYGFTIYPDGTSLFGGQANSNVIFSSSISLAAVALGKVHVTGNGASSATNALYIENSSSTPLMVVRNDGNVGINKTDPSERLDVNGNLIADTIKARADMITPKLKTGTATNNATFEVDGTMVMNGDATIFEDLNFSPLSASGVPATLPDYVTINNTTHREFTSANNQLCGDIKELPHAYKLGTTLQPHAHLFLKSGESVGTTGVTFVLYWELRQTTGTTFGSSTLTATSAQLANGNKVDIYTSAFAGAAELGAQLSCTIARTAGDAGDIVLLSWGVHYEADMIGSRTISSK